MLESPDLQNEISNIGVEVTLVCDQNYTEKSKHYLKHGGDAPFGVYGDKDIIEAMIKSYDDKILKLNTNYRIFNRNELFLIVKIAGIYQEDITKFLTIIKGKKYATYKYCFDKIYILNCFNRELFICDCKKEAKILGAILLKDLEQIVEKSQNDFCNTK